MQDKTLVLLTLLALSNSRMKTHLCVKLLFWVIEGGVGVQEIVNLPNPPLSLNGSEGVCNDM